VGRTAKVDARAAAYLAIPARKLAGKVSRTSEAGGRFEQTCIACLAACTALMDHGRAGDGEAAGKIKDSCPACGLNAWAKPDVRLICGCREEMEAEEQALQTPRTPDGRSFYGLTGNARFRQALDQGGLIY
jgi:hypothetical protein